MRGLSNSKCAVCGCVSNGAFESDIHNDSGRDGEGEIFE